jgi:phosphoglycolate phosphatase
MIGDRKFDIIGAQAHGLDVIAVSYGYGEKEELEALAPTAIVPSVDALRQLLLD